MGGGRGGGRRRAEEGGVAEERGVEIRDDCCGQVRCAASLLDSVGGLMFNTHSEIYRRTIPLQQPTQNGRKGKERAPNGAGP